MSFRHNVQLRQERVAAVPLQVETPRHHDLSDGCVVVVRKSNDPELGALLAAQAVSGKTPIVCGTPAGERHELGALMAAVVMAMHGRRVLYLGADLPASELANAALLSGAWAVALSVVGLAPAAARRELEELCRVLPNQVQVLVGGRRVPELRNLPARVRLITSLPDLEDWLLTAAE